ncbi:MAG: hypothetical protein GYA34_18130 [Chloroflexi bacterium]|nr:hypothetical protein [Chloroflexota bacterium]
MAEKQVYRFVNHCQGKKLALNKVQEKSRERRLSGHSLCPGNGARSVLRSLLSVALSSIRAPQFYHAGLFLPLDGFSL